MLAHLMFAPRLRRVLLAGCGGGAIARWIHARAPEVAGEAVEISPTVARLAREYFEFPPPQSRWRLMVGDVRAHLVERPDPYDFILVDLEENQETPGWVTGPDFLAACQASLAHGGTLTLNLLHGDSAALSEALLRVRAVFGPDLVLLSEPDHDNLLVLAFAGPAPALPDATRLQERGRHWGIDFTALARRATCLEA
jgi:spermidine synthase